MNEPHPHHPKPSRAARGFAVLHHALAAGVMASAMLGLEHHRALDWLDAVMLHMVAQRSPALEAAATASAPQLLLIDSLAYAETFGLRSPLDRSRLVQVLDDALSARPAALLVDLQLEPGTDEPADRALDQRLRQAALPDAEGHRTRVVLPVPEPRNPALDRKSIAWMRDLCKAGVHFGSAQVRSHFGTVVRFDEDGSTLASQARPRANESSPICELLAHTGELHALWLLLEAPSRSTNESTPIQPSVMQAVMQQALNWRPELTRQTLLQRRPEVVVIGGAYDSRDSFLTHALDGLAPGAAVHAASIAGAGKVSSSHALAWLFDLVLGTALGFLFQALWQLVGQTRAPAQGVHWRFMLAAWCRLVMAGGIWLLALSIAIGLMALMGRLMAHGLWLNPGPVVLGMFLHALLLKDAVTEAAHQPPDTWARFTAHSPSWPLQLMAIAAAVIYLLKHALH
jgi:hypothetical protein